MTAFKYIGPNPDPHLSDRVPSVISPIGTLYQFIGKTNGVIFLHSKNYSWSGTAKELDCQFERVFVPDSP